LNARGYVHLQQRNLKQALDDFNAAIRLNPKYANAYRNRSAVKRLLGDAAGSEADAAMEKQILASP
jgi:tetratricopeptide (TPR) repeat protein